jgi:hypothetical protein
VAMKSSVCAIKMHIVCWEQTNILENVIAIIFKGEG